MTAKRTTTSAARVSLTARQEQQLKDLEKPLRWLARHDPHAFDGWVRSSAAFARELRRWCLQEGPIQRCEGRAKGGAR